MFQPCICCSGKIFEQCCDRYLNHGERAKTPEKLMRSRYSAFALGDYGQYLLDTWLPEYSSGLDIASLSIRSQNWSGLDIVSKSQKGNDGFVEFKAFYLDSAGVKQAHHEHSIFVRKQGRWFYKEGFCNKDF